MLFSHPCSSFNLRQITNTARLISSGPQDVVSDKMLGVAQNQLFEFLCVLRQGCAADRVAVPLYSCVGQ